MNWVCLYSDVLTELYGEDRDDAMRYIEDDMAFDAWLKRYSIKNRTKNRTSGRGGHVSVSKEQYFNRMKGTLPQPRRRDGQEKPKGMAEQSS